MYAIYINIVRNAEESIVKQKKSINAVKHSAELVA
jgi:hypothetical protein